jgi:hypothetical protein
MKLRTVAVLALLPFTAGWSASAQTIQPCASQEVTIIENEPVQAPEGYKNVSVAIYNTEDSIEITDVTLPTPRPGTNGSVSFTPDAWIVTQIENLKQASVKAPEKLQLLWTNTDTKATCLQPFTVLFVIPQRVLLNEVGIESRYVNPVAPVHIDGRPLQFVNDTGDRTFVVTIPFVYPNAEVSNSYALAQRTRKDRSLSDVACGVIKPCPTTEIDNLETLRRLLEAVSQAKAASLKPDCFDAGTNTPRMKNGGCFVEYLFWRAVQPLDVTDLENFATLSGDSPKIQYVVEQASADVVDGFLRDRDQFPNAADFDAASSKQATLIPSKPASGILAGEADKSGLTTRFEAARIDLAKKALIAAIRAKMGFPPPKERRPSRTALGRRVEEWLQRPSVEGPGFTCEIQEFLDALDEKRDSWNRPGAYYACKRREAQAVSKLLLSYSPNATVPYSGLPATLIPTGPTKPSCDHLNSANKAEALMMERMVNAESLSEQEQGIEITGCTSDGTNTTCSATATIPPYGVATFSRSTLAHHPGARIRFTASFFGDTEIPGNANGYVTRSDATAADAKPKRSFSLQIGGDASYSKEPDKAIGGQLDHATASGSLAFQFAGPVEASATLQFKSGDLGGKSSQTSASQYQAKVYGPNRLVLQYGNVTFAKPSAGIAVNVTGEGVQLIAGGASLGYVVLRESDNQEANKKDQDKSLVFLQTRNLQFRSGTSPLRTADFIALYGKESKEPSMDAPSLRPYHFWSAGGEIRLGAKSLPSLGLSLAGYYSERDMDSSEPSMDPLVLKDGSGYVGFLRASWTDIATPSWREKQELRPAFSMSGFGGYGSGNKAPDFNKDKGYLGENAGYANDMIFLSKVANSDAFSSKLGKGLSNKTYAGLQFTTWRFSPLALLSRLVGAENDIASQSTILTLHAYRFNHEVEAEHRAGEEIDLAFNLEAPKNIQWVLSGAYYFTPPAIDKVLGRKANLWMASAKLSIKLDNL